MRDAEMGELGGGLEPAEEVEIEVVAAGGTVAEEGENRQKRSEGDEDAVGSLGHGVVLSGNREQGTGNREQGTGNREQGTGCRV